jgi:hypothetical protein
MMTAGERAGEWSICARVWEEELFLRRKVADGAAAMVRGVDSVEMGCE